MKSSLLTNEILRIQDKYKKLLVSLLPKLKSDHSHEALDEINIFWVQHIGVVQLYLKSVFASEESYVFTASTYLNFDDKEHLPFLMLGDNHVLDDPLSKYAEICNQISEELGEKNTSTLFRQIVLTAEDNIKVIENCHNEIIILPLRLLSQSNDYSFLYKLGECFFIELFSGIKNFEDYFKKCNTIEDIQRYTRQGVDDMIMFSEDDDKTLPFKERYYKALQENEDMIDQSKSDAFKFYVLVYGCIQQAIDVLASCIEYNCIPFIRYPVLLHYTLLLSKIFTDLEHVLMMRFKMYVAFMLYQLSDKNILGSVCLEDFLIKKHEFMIDKKLLQEFMKANITAQNFFQHSINKPIEDMLAEFYNLLNR